MQLARSSDLVSLCLTCKEYHELVVPDLYKTLTLDVGSKTDKRIASLLNPENIGLKYIRNVELYKAVSWSPWRNFHGTLHRLFQGSAPLGCDVERGGLSKMC